jgi:hypothetical protein
LQLEAPVTLNTPGFNGLSLYNNSRSVFAELLSIIAVRAV